MSEVGNFSSGKYDYARYAEDEFDRLLKELEDDKRDLQLRELKLYRLAKLVVPWSETELDYSPLEGLDFLREVVVKGNTWGSFTAFCEVWKKQYREINTRKLEKHLPIIWEAGEESLDDDDYDDDEDGVDESEALADRVANKLSVVLSEVADSSEDKDSKLASAVAKLGSQNMVALEQLASDLSVILKGQSDLKRSIDLMKIIVLVMVIIIAALFLIP